MQLWKRTYINTNKFNKQMLFRFFLIFFEESFQNLGDLEIVLYTII